MIRIKRGDAYGFDFESPIVATSEQTERLVALFKKMGYLYVKTKKTDHIRDKRVGERIFRRWEDVDEYVTLCDPFLTNIEISEKLGRPEMTIQNKRADFLLKFDSWRQNKGLVVTPNNLKELIMEFLKEQEIQRKIRYKEAGERRRKINQLRRDIDERKSAIVNWSSEKKRTEIDFLIKMKQLEGDAESIINSNISILQEEIDELEEEIEKING